jgi:secreted trypsin-like serine protease
MGVSDNFIINEDLSHINDKPVKYTVGIVGRISGNICTGVIISDKLILTAAHCFEDSDEVIEVRFGSELQNNYEAIESEFIYLSSDFKGSQNSKQKGINTGDLAIIVLKKAIPTNYDPIEIYPDSSLLPARTPLLFSGFGLNKTEITGGVGSGKLHEGIVYLSQAQYSDTEFSVDQTNGAGACNGDSGGPIFFIKDNKLFLAGISSRGNSDCSFSVYTNSRKILSFYQEVIAKINEGVH